MGNFQAGVYDYGTSYGVERPRRVKVDARLPLSGSHAVSISHILLTYRETLSVKKFVGISVFNFKQTQSPSSRPVSTPE